MRPVEIRIATTDIRLATYDRRFRSGIEAHKAIPAGSQFLLYPRWDTEPEPRFGYPAEIGYRGHRVAVRRIGYADAAALRAHSRLKEFEDYDFQDLCTLDGTDPAILAQDVLDHLLRSGAISPAHMRGAIAAVLRTWEAEEASNP